MKAVLGFILGLLVSTQGSSQVPPGGEPLDHLLEPARQGNRQARDELIRRYTPLVLRVGAQVTGRYLQVGRDDEVSIGLMALNEAIDRYDPTRGAAFVTFSEVVIRRRLIDHVRREGRRNEVPLSELETEDDEGNRMAGAEERESLTRYSAEQEAEERREEIRRYTLRLAEFGICFADLVTASPRHADARDRAFDCARALVTDPLLTEHLRSRRELPLKALETRVGVSRKTLERQRRYIIAVTLILLGEFSHLRRYVTSDTAGSGAGGSAIRLAGS